MTEPRLATRFHNHKWPLSLSYFIESKCNLSCRHCYVDGGQRIPSRPGHLSDHRHIIDSILPLGYQHVVFVGGEPTLSPFLRSDIEFVLDQGLNPVIFTNGFNLDPDLVSFAADNPPTSFVLSLYGDRDCHNRVTQVPGSFSRSMYHMDMILRRQVPLQINTAVGRFNADSVRSLIESICDRPIDWISLLYFSPLGRGLSLKDQRFSIPEWSQYLDQYRKLDDFAVSIFAELMAVPKNQYRIWDGETRSKASCTAVRGRRLSLDSKGNIFPCPMFAGELQPFFSLTSHALMHDSGNGELCRKRIMGSTRADFRAWTASKAVQDRIEDSFPARVFCPAHHRVAESLSHEERRMWVAVCPFLQEQLAGPRSQNQVSAGGTNDQ